MTEHNVSPVASTCITDASTRSFTPSANEKELPDDTPTVQHHWYPMYVKYRQELSVKKALEEKSFRTFLPMKEHIYKRGSRVVTEYEPAIHNLLFVYSFKERISWMKMYHPACLPLQYMSRRHLDGPSEVLTIPDAVMTNFIRAASVDDPLGQRSFLETDLSITDVDRRIRFTDGQFKGVEGVIKRVDKNRAMVIPLLPGLNLKITITSATDVEFL